MVTIAKFVQQRTSTVAAVAGAVLGLVLGLIIAWGIWPVKWTNATPAHLRGDFQRGYLTWVAEQYAADQDIEKAQARLGVQFWEPGQLSQALEEAATDVGGEQAIHLRELEAALETAPAPEQPSGGGGNPLLKVCGGVLLLLAAVALAFYLFKRVKGGGRVEAPEPVAPAEGWGEAGPPLAQFSTTYNLGDDHYDPSFSIELESGEFMGECGVGISETIGVGSPNKVTAFEIWLFDKNDIRTVTKVLMSEYAFNDDALRAKLAPKGEPVLAGPDKQIVLDTKTLTVKARVVNMAYGSGELPANSFFETLTVELTTWVKPGAAEEEVEATIVSEE